MSRKSGRDGWREMALKTGGAAALLAILAGMGSHPLPGSPDSLLRGVLLGVPAGGLVGLLAYLVVRARNAKGGHER